ncbi:CLUMA_CG011485, isoform A [Clunio marinus]|uniref:CLUMA_CG011485, isoform A n=1 Tax=Clunio marinus TaxID=568069 RepID=A0A1J1ICV8_9DIPT|nr:CLUMA_CG011485, isoform A [Clunio marinus]
MNNFVLNYTKRAGIENKRKARINQVRHQSKEIAKEVLTKVQGERRNQIQQTLEKKLKELEDLKNSQVSKIGDKFKKDLYDFGEVQVETCESSCEKDIAHNITNENDFIVTESGHYKMLKDAGKQRQKSEKKLARKRNLSLNKSTQADSMPLNEVFSVRNSISHDDLCRSVSKEKSRKDFSDNIPIRSSYNPNYFRSNSVDSSLDSSKSSEIECDNKDNSESCDYEEFDQITNLLKITNLNCEQVARKRVKIFSTSSHSSLSNESDIHLENDCRMETKSILKNSKPLKSKVSSENFVKNNSVKYVDFSKKFTKQYQPGNDIITTGKVKKRNQDPVCRFNNPQQEKTTKSKISNKDVKQQNNIQTDNALRKESIRRDYECLQQELEDIYSHDYKGRTSEKALKSTSLTHLKKQDMNRELRKNHAFDKALSGSIIMCQSDSSEKNEAQDFNVAWLDMLNIESTGDIRNRNAQKKIQATEQNNNAGSELKNQLFQSLKKLKEDKNVINSIETDLHVEQSENKSENECLQIKKQKIAEREKMLEDKIKDILTTYKKTVKTSVETSCGEKASTVIHPIEINIRIEQPPLADTKKVNYDSVQRSPRKNFAKIKKKIETVDQTEKVDQTETVKKTKPVNKAGKVDQTETDNKTETVVQTEPYKDHRKKTRNSQKETQTTLSLFEPFSPILKNREELITPKVFNKSSDSSQSVSTTYQSLPEQIHLNVEPQSESKLNPTLLHYITRLLGMNKNVGNRLDVSISSINTPESSILNTIENDGSSSGNLTPPFDQNHLKKLQQFINDNYSFLREINETLSHKQHNDDDTLKVENIWKNIFDKKKLLPHPNKSKYSHKNDKKESQSNGDKNLPKQTTSKEKEKPLITPFDILSVAKHVESHMLNNYAEYTANCQRRINELAQQMESVRREKLKLIEYSISSSEFGHNTTYKEILIPKSKSQDTSGSEMKNANMKCDDPPSEEVNNNLQKQTRSFGVSKDSGISVISRPLTSSDFRDSPESRLNSDDRENSFQPITSNQTKHLKVPAFSFPSAEMGKDFLYSKSLEGKFDKLSKQQFYSNRFSPKHDMPLERYELSTIVEVETPVASKTNIHENIEELKVKSFPNYEQYATNLQQFLISTSCASQNQSLPMLINEINDINKDLQVKSFVHPKDYDIGEISKDKSCVSSSSSSSIIDIEEELKKRKIIEKPFESANISYQQSESNLIFETHENEYQITGKITENENPEGTLISSSMEFDKTSSNKLEAEIKSKESDLKSSSTSSSCFDQPMNLKEFLARELIKKTKDDKSNSSSSLSSQFMRSLLNANSTQSDSNMKDEETSEYDKLRTSTPVNQKKKLEK